MTQMQAKSNAKQNVKRKSPLSLLFHLVLGGPEMSLPPSKQPVPNASISLESVILAQASCKDEAPLEG